MKRNQNTTRKFAFSIATVGVAALVFGGTLDATANAESRFTVTTDIASPASQTSFTDEFIPFETLPDAPEPAAHVVDISTFEPPVEIEPELAATSVIGTGIASYYGRKFQGRRTANGERFDMNAMTAAHKTLPFGTRVAVTNPRNGKTVTVRINDRGPYAHGRLIDLSRAAATQIGIVQRGHGTVELARIVG